MENISFDTKVEMFKDRLIRDINESTLPLSILEYVLKETLEAVRIEKNKIIINDKQKMNNDTIPSND